MMRNIIIALAILTVSAVNAFSQDWDDVYYSPSHSTTDVYSDADGDTYVTNNYYDTENQSDFFDDDEYEYYYSSRIRRFHRNNRACNSYYSPYFVDRYYYDADPYYYGSSIYYTPNWAFRVNPVNVNIGLFSWGDFFTFGWSPWRSYRRNFYNNYAFYNGYGRNNFYDNYRYNNYYNNINYYYGYNSGYYGSGYYGGSGYYNGYNNGFNDCPSNNSYTNTSSYSNTSNAPRGGGRGAGRYTPRKTTIAQSAEAYTNNDVASINNNAGFSIAPVPERHLSSEPKDRIRKDYFSEPTIREDVPSRNTSFGGTTTTRSIKKENSAVRGVEDPGYNNDIRSDRSKINNNSTRDANNTRQFGDAETERTTRIKDSEGRTKNTNSSVDEYMKEYIQKEKEQNEYRRNIERERSDNEREKLEREYQRETERERSSDRERYERENREKQDRERYDRERREKKDRERYEKESREKQDRERYERNNREKQDRAVNQRNNRAKQERSNNSYRKDRSSNSSNKSFSNSRSNSSRSNSSKSKNSSSKSRSSSKKTRR